MSGIALSVPRKNGQDQNDRVQPRDPMEAFRVAGRASYEEVKFDIQRGLNAKEDMAQRDARQKRERIKQMAEERDRAAAAARQAASNPTSVASTSFYGAKPKPTTTTTSPLFIHKPSTSQNTGKLANKPCVRLALSPKPVLTRSRRNRPLKRSPKRQALEEITLPSSPDELDSLDVASRPSQKRKKVESFFERTKSSSTKKSSPTTITTRDNKASSSQSSKLSSSQRAASSQRAKPRKLKAPKTGTELESEVDSQSDRGYNTSSDEDDAPNISIDPANLLKAKRDSSSSDDEPSQKVVEHKELCPFCDGPLPLAKSRTLENLLQDLLDRPHLIHHPTKTNPNAKKLPVIETAHFCSMHRQEQEIVPAGIEQGWPARVDWTALTKRIKTLASEREGRIRNVVLSASESDFFLQAKRDQAEQGKLVASNVANQFASFDADLPGYYGLRGAQLIERVLTDLFVNETPILNAVLVQPLEVETFVRRVLVPECAVLLIAADLDISNERAIQVREQSRAFGQALYPLEQDNLDDDDDLMKKPSSVMKQAVTQKKLTDHFKTQPLPAVKSTLSTSGKKSKARNDSSSEDEPKKTKKHHPKSSQKSSPSGKKDTKKKSTKKEQDDEAPKKKLMNGKLAAPQARKETKSGALDFMTMTDSSGDSSD